MLWVSFPCSPNGIVEIDYEFIHIFRKPGNLKECPKGLRKHLGLRRKNRKGTFQVIGILVVPSK